MGWGSGETRSFVKLYLSHKCLWDFRDSYYKDSRKRLEAYHDICKKFQALHNIKLNKPEFRNKIKSLRSTYVQYLRKGRKERRCFESLHKGSWLGDMHECFSEINIPRKMYERDASYDDQQETETELEDQSQKVWVPENDVDKYSGDEQENPLISPTEDDYILLLKTEPEQSDELPISYGRKRKYNHGHSCDSTGNSSTDYSVKDIKKEKLSNEDEFDIYGKYIASQLREMGLQRALRIQLQIQNIVSEARLDSLSD